MLVRHAVRWPLRSFLTSAGVAMAVAVLVMSLHWTDAMDNIVDTYFFQAQHQDATIALAEAQASRVMRGIEHLPGVLAAEPMRSVRVRFRAGNRSRREVIQGIMPEARLYLVYDASGRVLRVPGDGLVLSTKLAELLGVARGDMVTAEILEGRRAVRQLRVADLFETYIGTPAYMHIDALNRLMLERPMVNGAQVLVDQRHAAALFGALKEVPQVSAVTLRRALVDSFDETMGETILIFISFFVGFSATLGMGVVYNSTRIALSERGRELATLRVLGFSLPEVSYILLGEVLLLILIGLPLGCAVGLGLTWVVGRGFDTELYRIPFAVEASTVGFAVLITLVATLASLAIVRRRLRRLDLIAVLKTRE